jgi:hypothetical protein
VEGYSSRLEQVYDRISELEDKIEIKGKTLVKQDKEGPFILIKGAINQKEILIINLYVPNVSVLSFIKHTLKDLEAQIDTNTVVMGDFNTCLSTTGRSSTQ